jgi:hypothetical protein
MRKDLTSPVRTYTIGATRFVVSASVKDGAKEDAATKVRRLIRNDILNKTEK